MNFYWCFPDAHLSSFSFSNDDKRNGLAIYNHAMRLPDLIASRPVED